jgi:hypothetical protein
VIRYREIAPPPCLQAFLSTFWILEHDADGATPQRIVPDVPLRVDPELERTL